MSSAILLILGGLVLLALGAEGLVRGASAIALRMGVTPLVIGLTIVAFGTGSPEMIVSLQAALAGSSDLALGNIVGSNIANIALMLGLSALVRPLAVRSVLLRREMPVLIVVTLALVAMLMDGVIGRADGAILAAAAIAYTAWIYLAARREGQAAKPASAEAAVAAVAADTATAGTATPAPVAAAAPSAGALRSLLFVAGGFAGLLVGAHLLVRGAVTIAQSLGMSEVVIGLTVIAIGTSLPELATSVVAAWRNDADVAFGNVIGSNILNILLVLGVVAVIQPIGAAGLRTLDLVAMVAAAVLLYPLLWRGRQLSRLDGGVLLAGYVAYLVFALR